MMDIEGFLHSSFNRNLTHFSTFIEIQIIEILCDFLAIHFKYFYFILGIIIISRKWIYSSFNRNLTHFSTFIEIQIIEILRDFLAIHFKYFYFILGIIIISRKCKH